MAWGEPHEPKPEEVLRRKIDRALDAVLEEAATMEAECSSPPCTHAQGMRIAAYKVRDLLELEP